MLLVSSDFLKSEFVNEIELEVAMERHEAGEASVIPIIVQDCAWKKYTALSKLQAPLNGEAVGAKMKRARDTAWKSVVEDIGRHIEKLKQRRQMVSTVRTT